jgi:hypothetical protein
VVPPSTSKAAFFGLARNEFSGRGFVNSWERSIVAKKGIVARAVRTAVKAAEKAIAPSPLAKKMIAAGGDGSG